MRLIDADKLLDDMKKELEKAAKDENLDKDECMVILTSAIALKDFVNRQPTGFDIDDILRQCKDKAIQLMNKQYNEDEYHMFSKGVQAMYLGLEKIIKENKIYSEIDVDMCINCTKSKYSNQGRPYCAKEERHLDSFNYKPDWCPLKVGGIDD